MVEQSPSQLQLHTLTSSSPDAAVQRVLDLSNVVFEDVLTDPNDNHGLLSHWRTRLADPRSVILYITTSSGGDNEDGGLEQSDPLGFFFSFPRTHSELGFETLHVWLAGVSPAARGLGIFPLLVERTRQHARAQGFEWLSVATIPSRFTKMYRILGENGWELVGWRRGEPEAVGSHVLMKIRA